MNKNTILVLYPLLPAEMSVLEEEYDVIRLWDARDPESLLQERARDVQAILSTGLTRGVSARLMAACPNLEIIVQYAVGYDNVDLEAAQERGIVIANTPGISANDVADMALCLLLNVVRRVVEADMFVRVGRWHSGVMPLATSLSGKTVGIVGLGQVGSAVARRAEAFDMRVVYTSRSRKEDVPYDYYEILEDMARDSDFLVLACSGGENTKNLITYKILEALGSKGYLINVARGSIVNEEDLLIALSNGTIAGAGLDVFANEPNVPEAMFKMDNVVLTPHMADSTLETRSKMGQLVLDNLRAHFSGENLPTPVRLAS